MTPQELIPHMFGGPIVLCYDLAPTEKLRSSIAALFKKYPDITLACFETECYECLREEAKISVLFSPGMSEYLCEKYRVIGILCGSDRLFPDDRLKVMRV